MSFNHQFGQAFALTTLSVAGGLLALHAGAAPPAKSSGAKTSAILTMSWPQVYDGKYWKADVAAMYGVDSIPRAYLVDGDTGKIIAIGDNLRGPALDGVISKAVATKSA